MKRSWFDNMTYQEALAYLHSFADYERSGHYTRNLDDNLLREARLLALLSNPQQSYTSTLIAGTKGKGSTAAFIEQVLRQADIRTGLYTQPDLHTFRERMRVNGCQIDEDAVAALLSEVRAAVEQMQTAGEFPSFIMYEAVTALAFLYFCRQDVEHAVIEVGLGGRFDATNVLHPLVSVITSISYDHVEILGNTLSKIANEKAGIVKPQGRVVTSAQNPEALLTIAAVCQQQQAHLVRVGSADVDPAQIEVQAGLLPAISYSYRSEQHTHEGYQHFTVSTPKHSYDHLETPLLGQHQLENATAALATLELLHEQGIVWDEDAVRTGFRTVRWPGRMDILGYHPTIVVDGAHNADSMQKLMHAIHSSFTPQRVIVVFASMRDKDLKGMIVALAEVDALIVTSLSNPRTVTVEQLEKLCVEDAPNTKCYTAANSHRAMELALELAQDDDLICVTGSLHLAGEILRWKGDHHLS